LRIRDVRCLFRVQRVGQGHKASSTCCKGRDHSIKLELMIHVGDWCAYAA
jgi:hypothetical protein